MSKEQAQAFVNSLNALAPYVPPMLFAPVSGSPVADVLVAIAQGRLICTLRPANNPDAAPASGQTD
jgi:hypothetical protein